MNLSQIYLVVAEPIILNNIFLWCEGGSPDSNRVDLLDNASRLPRINRQGLSSGQFCISAIVISEFSIKCDRGSFSFCMTPPYRLLASTQKPNVEGSEESLSGNYLLFAVNFLIS